jgi:hypothetical protein
LAGLALRALSGIQGGSLPPVPRFFGGCVMFAMVHPRAILARPESSRIDNTAIPH